MRCCWIIALFGVSVLSSVAVADDRLSDARRLLYGGKYAEAAEIYAESAASDAAAALGLARALAAEGKLDEAARALESGPAHADLHAELGRLALERGDYASAERHVKAALEVAADQLLARWLRGELFRTSGRLDEAEEAYAWLIRYYNEHDAHGAESLRWIGLATARYAQWNRMADQFRFLVNDLYPSALEQEPDDWPSHFEAGRLLLKKYNRRDASKQFQAALAINPNAAEVHAAVAALALLDRDVRRAEASIARALEINPKLLEAHLLKAELAWANFRPQEALRLLEHDALPLNPAAEETLGRLAACYVLEDGFSEDSQAGRFGELVEEVTARNEHAGEFFFALAQWLDARHKLPEAERFYEEAIRRMPRQVGPKAALGMMHMHSGREARAKELLAEAFEEDPFNVRTSNMLGVLEVLDRMETLEGEHVIVRFDGGDRLLSHYALGHLDAVYPELCEKFGYRPAEKPLVEIFSTARGAGGHQWFSTRMTGLPFLGTVAASTGKIVAMVSPNDAGVAKPFNWAQVLTHEMVHVVTLQQTGFNIPHWYTEGLAVWCEGYPRPQKWNELLVRREARGELFDLGTINFGFIRPQSCDDVTLAYCQAELYVDYLIEEHGTDAVSKLLNAYADNLTTAEAISKALGVSTEQFEQGYGEYLKGTVAGLSGFEAPPEGSFAELLAAQRDNPEDAELAARTAYGYLRRGANREARQLASRSIELAPKRPLAVYVLARIHVRAGRTEEAMDLLRACLDREAPDAKVLNLLAALELKAENYGEAARFYELGSHREPENLRWVRSLALVHARSENEVQLADALARLAAAEADNLAARKELARLALRRRDFHAAADWANQALQIDVKDAEVHGVFAEALASGHNYADAIEEYPGADALLESLQETNLP